MNRLTKILFYICVITLGAGIYISVTHAHIDPIWTVLLPIGATMYGLCLIHRIFQDESAKFDEEERARRELALHSRPESQSSQESGHTVADHGHQHAGAH